MVNKGFAYIGHMFSKGFSVVDVRDPRNPKPAGYFAGAADTWNIHLQTHGDLLLVINAKDMFAAAEFQDERAYYKGALGKKVGTAAGRGEPPRNWTAGMAVYDISEPAEPRQIGFMPVEGGGIHRIWYTGGRWAYASALLDGFTDYIFITIDMADPTKPLEAGRWWMPGMNLAAGETPDWAPTRRYGLHHPIVSGDTAYCAWRDAGLVDARRRRPQRAQADRPPQLVPALRRRHAQLPAPARSRPARRARRGGARQHGGRPQADLAVRHPGALESDQHLDLPDTVGGGLREEGRPFRPAQRSREPARQLRELGTHLRDLPECRRAGLRHPRPVPAGRGRRLRPAGPGTDGRPSPRTAAGDPVLRCLRRRQGLIYCNDYNGGLYILEFNPK